MLMSEFADKKSANNEGRLYYIDSVDGNDDLIELKMESDFLPATTCRSET